MNWKNEYQLLDLEENKTVGFTCKKCGLYYTETVKELLTYYDKQTYPAEIEKTMKCKKWGCNGSLRIEINQEHLIEAFQGGLP